LLAAVYKSLGCAWSDADITELLSFRCKSILAVDLNAKHPFWNSAVSNPSDKKLMALFDLNEFEISSPQCVIVLLPEMVTCWILWSIRMSDVIVSDILDSDHLPVVFPHIGSCQN
jgi:hypothetical protein